RSCAPAPAPGGSCVEAAVSRIIRLPWAPRIACLGWGASPAYAGSSGNGQGAGVKPPSLSRSAVASCRDIGEPGARPYPPNRPRSAMKITGTRTDLVELPADEPLAGAAENPNGKRPIVTLRVETDQGIEGVGVAYFGGAL